MTVNKIRVRNLAEAGLSHAVVLEKILSNQPKMLSAILIGNNIVNISASSLMTVLVTDVLGNKYVGIGTGVLTLLVLIFGEITPKTSATIYSETLSLKFAKPIYLIMQVLTPLIVVVDVLSKGVLKMIHVDPNKKQDAITEDELRTIVEVSHEEGVIESDEKKMIYNVFDFGDSVAKDIMVPRIDMTFLDVNASYQEIMDIFRQEKYTRYPVYEETTDNVIGIVNIKDLFLIPKDKEFKLRDYLREPYYTYEFKKTTELMVELRKTMNSVAIVLDEYGATAGLITLEDMLEEIVGEIRDEYDADEEDSIRKINPKEYVIEMFCDRVAACKIYNKENYYEKQPLDYYMNGRSRRLLHPDSAKLLEKYLNMLARKGEAYTFRYIHNYEVIPLRRKKLAKYLPFLKYLFPYGEDY